MKVKVNIEFEVEYSTDISDAKDWYLDEMHSWSGAEWSGRLADSKVDIKIIKKVCLT